MDSPNLHKVEKGFAILALFALTASLTGIFFPLLHQKFGIELPDGKLLWQDFLFVIFLCTISLLLLHRKAALPMLAQNRLMLFLLLLAFMSASWSVVPDHTIALSTIMVFNTALGLYLAVRFSPAVQLRLLLAALGIGALLSFLLVLLFPEYGISGPPHDGCWEGIFGHKNTLGRLLLLGCIGLILLIKSGAGFRWVVYPALGLMLLLALFSGSRTAEISFLVVLLLLPFYRSLHMGFNLTRKKLVIGLLLGCAVAALFLSNMNLFLNAVGREATITGRTVMWAEAFKAGLQHPWQGYGYKGFWIEGSPFMDPRFDAWLNGHNGFLDLWLELGLFGLIIFLVIFIGAFREAIERARSGSSPDHLWPIVYLTFLFFINLTESMIFPGFFWVLTSATIFSLGNSKFNVQRASQDE